MQDAVSPLPDMNPEPQFSEEELVFSDEEMKLIERYRAQYPAPQGAVMKVLWLAQEKFGFLAPEVIRLSADTLGLPYALVYGVATFYTQYYKDKTGKYVLDVCTCYTCQLCGGYDMLHYIEETLGIKEGETTDDGLFSVRQAECLGACGSAPMLQVTNGPYVHNLSREKVDTLLGDLRAGKMPPFVSITLPQDADEMGGNRRADAEAVEEALTPPVSKTFK